MEARRSTGPLFWMHGDESRQQLERELTNVLNGHNGTFTTEPRPHSDWLGEGWYRDLGICLEFARKNNLTCFIYDDWWWPSQMMGGRVPPQYGSKRLQTTASEVDGGTLFEAAGILQTNLVAVVAGRVLEGGAIDGASVTNLTALVQSGKLVWNAPEGHWRVMQFSWRFQGKEGGQQRYVSVDGASADCVDWFIKTVYQAHYDRFSADYGKTIVGYFYDEPETQGDWGSEVPKVIAERGFDLARLLVAFKFKLAGDEQTAARYAYLDCFADAWGRTMYGGMSRWCRAHHVASMGHFMEHADEFYNLDLSAGNMMQLQKYSDMGGIDLVCDQVYPGQRDMGMYQMPKIGSSLSHTFNKSNDIAFCEIFGGYGQKLTYPQMKWLTDWEQVRGINYMIPHSFNPHAPYDTDYPPYFNNGGFEPRWPLFRVWADYNNRLSLLLTGGRHVAPVAFLHLGQSYHVGKSTRPEELTSALQDALFDCDWLLHDAWENDATIEKDQIRLHKETYQVLVIPSAEVIPYPTLAKANEFFEHGGVVVAYGMLPSKSATPGHSSAEIQKLCESIWGGAQPGLACSKASPGGGRSYFLPSKPSPEDLQQVLTRDAQIHPTLEVAEGETHHWLHVLHRQKLGCDVFLVCNQNHLGQAEAFTFNITAAGNPECWDPMRNEVTIPTFTRMDANHVSVQLTLEPSESVLLVFQPEKRNLPPHGDVTSLDGAKGIPVTRAPVLPNSTAQKTDDNPLQSSSWVWYPEGNPAVNAPVETIYFRKTIEIAGNQRIKSARFVLAADNEYALYVNGNQIAANPGITDAWRRPDAVEIGSSLKPGNNLFAIAAVNTLPPGPAGLIGHLAIEFSDGAVASVSIDTSWKVTRQVKDGWFGPGYDEAGWLQPKVVAAYGGAPWGKIGSTHIESPVKADPFDGHFDLPATISSSNSRVYLVMDRLEPEAAASVTVNGNYAGGLIGKPFQLDITEQARAGANAIHIEPFSPTTARIIVAPR